MKKKIIENLKTVFYALLIAFAIRTFLFQPFYIPSSSMEPNLLVGDRLFVSKYSYGYSRHSFPYSPNFSNKRYFDKNGYDFLNPQEEQDDDDEWDDDDW